jgi:hypothetical protein
MPDVSGTALRQRAVEVAYSAATLLGHLVRTTRTIGERAAERIGLVRQPSGSEAAPPPSAEPPANQPPTKAAKKAAVTAAPAKKAAPKKTPPPAKKAAPKKASPPPKKAKVPAVAKKGTSQQKSAAKATKPVKAPRKQSPPPNASGN